MTRKTFLEDLERAASPGKFDSITAVRSGDEVGAVRFTFTSDAAPSTEIEIEAVVSGQHLTFDL